MKKTTCCLAVLFAPAVLGQASSEIGPSLVAIANRLSALPPSELNREDLPAGREEAILEFMRKRGVYSTALLRLNDQSTIDGIVKYVRKIGQDPSIGDNSGRYGSYLPYNLPRCQSPYLLDELAELLYEGERQMEGKLKPETWDEWWEGSEYQTFVAQIITGVAANVPEFSEAVRSSAKGFVPGGGEAVIAWYEANREALLAERFADVGPFPDFATFPYTWKKAATPAAEPPPAPEPAPSAPPEAPPAPPAPPPKAPPPSARPARLPWLLGAVAAALALGLWLKKRRADG